MFISLMREREREREISKFKTQAQSIHTQGERSLFWDTTPSYFNINFKNQFKKPAVSQNYSHERVKQLAP